MRLGALQAYGLLLAGVWVLVLFHGWPGHLSVDSVLALHEGRFGIRETWNPALFGWLLGVFDRVRPGTGLYVAAMSGLLLAAWAGLARLRPTVSWTAPVVLVLLAVLPQVFIWQAIVWKDVAFANCAIAGFVLLALGLRSKGVGWGWLAAAALLFAAAGLFRQNGLVATAAASAAIAWVRWPYGWRRAIGLAAGWGLAVAALTLVLSIVAQPQGMGPPDDAGEKGMRILQSYDLMGAEAIQAGRPLPTIDRVDPAAGDYIRRAAGRAWSPERVDAMIGDNQLEKVIYRLPVEAIRADWMDLVIHDPGLYLKIRLADFSWVFATPAIDRCLPVHLGVGGPPRALADLRIAPRQDLRDKRLFNYVTWFLDTPAMSHLTYAAVALALGLAFLIRRGPGDIPMAGLMAAGLAFTASFLPISLACDYRYLYFLDLTAITGALYFAIDPGFSRREGPRPARL